MSHGLTRSDGPYRYVILSKTKEHGIPVFNRHTLAESADTEESALIYAEARRKQGYWVDVYKELWHHTGEPE